MQGFISAGHHNPASPPPGSFLIQEYLREILNAEEYLSDLEESVTSWTLQLLKATMKSMLSIYSEMNGAEQAVVEDTKLPPTLAQSMLQYVNMMLDAGYNVAPHMVEHLSNMMYKESKGNECNQSTLH